MSTQELFNKIETYKSLQDQVDNLQKQLGELKEQIMAEMTNNGETKVETDLGIVASIVAKETYKYLDELAMIRYLKENGLAQYISEKVNVPSLNKELKKGQTLCESLKPMYNKVISYSFTVK